MTALNFGRCLKALLIHEGGNVDDPQDPGGRTSRGVTQATYDAWRVRQGLPKRDVWTADDAEVRAIYYSEYWERLCCDDLPAGVDYIAFDYGVNSGVGRAAIELQFIVGAKQDGQIGPLTLAAVAGHDPQIIVRTLCADRMAYLKGLKTWPRFGDGWRKRVADVQAMALQMAAMPQVA